MIRPEIPLDTKIHMIGIGGAGMSGLAVILANLGYMVTGSDQKAENIAPKLEPLGVKVYNGHASENVGDAGLVVASAAIAETNPEMQAAKAAGITIWSRAKMLGAMIDGNFSIGVSGTHGKTTTTSMLAMALEAGGLDPTVAVGGDVQIFNGNAKLGSSEYLVAEACEAFNSFLEMRPKIAVVTNIEADHLDCHGSLEGVKESFVKFLSNIKPDGIAVMCADCPNTREIIQSIPKRVVTYGLGDDSDCHAYDVVADVPEPSFQVAYMGRKLGEFTLRVPGIHNVLNALSVIAVCCELDVDLAAVREALHEFKGAGRRFEILGTAQDITVIDDYAHHPTEVRVTLEGAKTWGRRVVAVFQPHLFSRTRQFAREFADSLKLADVVVLSEIYPSREKPVPGVSASMISDMVNADIPGRARFISDKSSIPGDLMPILQPGDMVLVMGAGDIRSAGEELLEKLINDK